MIGTLDCHKKFDSRYIIPRRVDVWLPPDYELRTARHFPVLYMHDGQNLFLPEYASYNIDWGIDEAIKKLVDAGKISAPIVVGIWCTDKRRREYMPQRPLESAKGLEQKPKVLKDFGGDIESDAYLKFLVTELKPFIDQKYRTLSGPEHTFIMGSSMGGLISAYALCEYPDVFMGAGCLSTHWVAGEGIVIDYLAEALPKPGYHKIYFDYGTVALDASYEPYQKQMDEIMQHLGYKAGENWLTRRFEGAEHSERAWRERVHIPLTFLLGEI